MVVCDIFEFKNKILDFLGGISFELYLYQFMVLKVLKQCWARTDVTYFLLSVFLTVFIAWSVNSITAIINRKRIG